MSARIKDLLFTEHGTNCPLDASWPRIACLPGALSWLLVWVACCLFLLTVGVVAWNLVAWAAGWEENTASLAPRRVQVFPVEREGASYLFPDGSSSVPRFCLSSMSPEDSLSPHAAKSGPASAFKSPIQHQLALVISPGGSRRSLRRRRSETPPHHGLESVLVEKNSSSSPVLPSPTLFVLSPGDVDVENVCPQGSSVEKDVGKRCHFARDAASSTLQSIPRPISPKRKGGSSIKNSPGKRVKHIHTTDRLLFSVRGSPVLPALCTETSTRRKSLEKLKFV